MRPSFRSGLWHGGAGCQPVPLLALLLCCGAMVMAQETPPDAEQRPDLEKQGEEREQAAYSALLAGKPDAACKAAAEALAIWKRLHGENHWRITGARLALECYEKIGRLDAEERRRLLEALHLEIEADRLVGQRPADALAGQRQALDTIRQILGTENGLTAASLYNLARLLYRTGDRPAARQSLEEALAVRRKVFGPDHPQVSLTLATLGSLAIEQDDYAAARTWLDEALTISARAKGEDHPDTAYCLRELGRVFAAQGDWAAARPRWEQALAIRRKALPEGHPLTAQSFHDLGYLLRQLGEYPAARDHLEAALAIQTRTLGKEHPIAGETLSELGIVYNLLGKYDQARKCHQEALTIAVKTAGRESLEAGRSLTNLGLLLQDQGDYAAARLHFQQALAITVKHLGRDHLQTAQNLSNLGLLLRAQGDYAAARNHLTEAVAIFKRRAGPDHPHTALALNNLALAFEAQEEYGKARECLEEVLAILRKTYADDRPEMAIPLLNLGALLWMQGDYAAAQPTLEKALAILQKKQGPDHPHVATARVNLAQVFWAQGAYAAAQPHFEEALAIFHKTVGSEHPDVIYARTFLFLNLYAQGRYEEAEAEGWSAARGFHAARLRSGPAGLGRAGFAQRRSPLPFLAALLARKGKAEAAWQTLEENLARGLLDSLSSQQLRRQRWTPEERRREQVLLNRLQRLDEQLVGRAAGVNRPVDIGSSPQAELLRRQRDEVQAELLRLGAEMEEKYGTASGQVYDLARIQAQLPADAALVAWLDIPALPRSAEPNGEHWACVVGCQGPPIWVRLTGSGPDGTWTPADEALPARVRERLTRQPAEGEDARELLSRLRAQRLAPVEQLLRDRPHLAAVRHLIVLPSAALAGIPVEALTEHHLVSYTPSGTMFAWLQEQRPARDRIGDVRLLALGDPAFESAATGERLGPRLEGKPVRPLPFTRCEVESLARLFPLPGEAETLLGPRASEAELTRLARADQLRQFRYLHLATHGFGNPEGGLRSYLLLARDGPLDQRTPTSQKQEIHDGRLTAEQILHTWKLDADLVTLSACETGLGQQQGGEGYVGFAQALFLAGSRSLVLSLWQVDDQATALLMRRFYQNLLGRRDGLDRPLAKAAALDEAKRWLRGLTTAERDRLLEQLPGGTRGTTVALGPPVQSVHPYDHPYFWAAFILVGDPGEASAPPPIQTAVATDAPAAPTEPAWSWLTATGLLLAGLSGLLAIRLLRHPSA
ncbi:MAG TPA: CHAT domain-containing tetratricopeptide repeat protein [Gemmataceae bacterium]|nr:CHAT domain-containing tetratricopeptide repeat protein [Gemmataceae bacterium]